jgi:hypothetical protein
MPTNVQRRPITLLILTLPWPLCYKYQGSKQIRPNTTIYLFSINSKTSVGSKGHHRIRKNGRWTHSSQWRLMLSVHCILHMYSYCMFMYLHRASWQYSATLTGVFPYFWHGYVLHEGITYKRRVPRTSQMKSRFLRHTAAAMRAHNVLCKL